MLKTTVVPAAGLIVGGGIVQGLAGAQMRSSGASDCLDRIKDEAGDKAVVYYVCNTLKPLAVIHRHCWSWRLCFCGITSPINSQLPSRIVIWEWPNIDAVKSISLHEDLLVNMLRCASITWRARAKKLNCN